jgi:hypothetical protein
MSDRDAVHFSLAGPFKDPKDFLLAVMNSQAAPTDIRIEAAQALMPYFHVSKEKSRAFRRHPNPS